MNQGIAQFLRGSDLYMDSREVCLGEVVAPGMECSRQQRPDTGHAGRRPEGDEEETDRGAEQAKKLPNKAKACPLC